MTRCSFTWSDGTPCPKHPGMKTHQCKRQAYHTEVTIQTPCKCRCGAVRKS
jgi:hypothetical protein